MFFNAKETHLLVHKKSQYALETSENTLKKINHVEVGPINANNKRQLWLLEGHEGATVEIINGFTDNVLTEDAPRLVLRRGNANRHQLWKLEFISENEVRIRRAKGDEFLMLEGGKVKSIKVNSSKADPWFFQPV